MSLSIYLVYVADCVDHDCLLGPATERGVAGVPRALELPECEWECTHLLEKLLESLSCLS